MKGSLLYDYRSGNPKADVPALTCCVTQYGRSFHLLAEGENLTSCGLGANHLRHHNGKVSPVKAEVRQADLCQRCFGGGISQWELAKAAGISIMASLPCETLAPKAKQS